VVLSEGITEISDYAMINTTNIKSISLPNTLKTIGIGALRSTAFTSIDLKNVETLEYAALGMSQIVNLKADNLVYIGENAFRQTPLTEYVVGDTVKYVGKNAFRVSNLKTLTIGKNVETLDEYAFANCTSLKTVKFEDSSAHLSSYLFNKSAIEHFEFDNINNLTFGMGAIAGCNSLTSLEDFEGIETFSNSMFRLCTGLKDITIPESVKFVDAYCFVGCSNLTNVNLNSQTMYNLASFYNTPFESNNVDKAVQCYDDPTKYALVKMSSSLTSTTQIPDYEKITNVVRGGVALTGTTTVSYGTNSTLKEINFPNAEILSGGSFNSCTGVGTNISLPNIKQLGPGCFAAASVSFDLPEGLLFIGDQVFTQSFYVNRSTVTIPSTVVQIGGTYFEGPNNDTGVLGTHVWYGYAVAALKEFVVAEGNENFVAHEGVLYTKDYKYLVAYPSAKPEANYIMPEGCVDIYEMAFSRSINIETLTIANTFIVRKNAKNYPNFNGTHNCGLVNGIYHYCSLWNVYVKEGNTRYTSKDGILYTADMKELIYIAPSKNKHGQVVIDDQCEIIASKAFDFYYTDVGYNDRWVGKGPNSIHIGKNVKEICAEALEELNYYATTSAYNFTITSDSPYYTVNSYGMLVKAS